MWFTFLRLIRRLTRSANFYSLAIAASLRTLQSYSPTSLLFDDAVNFASALAPSVPRLSIHLVFWLIAAAVIRGFLGAGNWLYVLTRPHLRGILGYRTSIYLGDRRYGWELRRDMLWSFRSSPFMYCMLMAGLKMAFEEEKFLLEEFRRIPPGKVVRLLLLNPDSEHWTEMAQLITQSGQSASRDDFQLACSHALAEIRRAIPNIQIRYFDASLSWRLYIFQDRLYVSRYAKQPDSQFLPANLVPILAFDSANPKTKPMYEWFFSEFRRYCPPDWQRELPYPPLHFEED